TARFCGIFIVSEIPPERNRGRRRASWHKLFVGNDLLRAPAARITEGLSVGSNQADPVEGGVRSGRRPRPPRARSVRGPVAPGGRKDCEWTERHPGATGTSVGLGSGGPAVMARSPDLAARATSGLPIGSDRAGPVGETHG